MRPVVLIPAYQPGPMLAQLVSDLRARGVERIVAADDGSTEPHRVHFEALDGMEGVHICRHAINLGKGAALKTGINFALCAFPDISVLVTADADGQHHPDDILAIVRAGEQSPRALVIGVRDFRTGVPLRSRFGNEATRLAMRVLVGQKLRDTQSGLRSIPYALLPVMLKSARQGYEFELEMLLKCREARLPIVEIPIRTIYLDGNRSSHFSPVLDSMRIYFVLLRFAAASISAAVIDNAVFAAVFLATGSLSGSQIAARLCSMLFNYFAVRRVVFKSQGSARWQLLAYAGLVIVSGTASYGLIRLLTAYAHFGVFAAKILAESALFFVNFLVQRDWIFAGTEDGANEEERRDLAGRDTGSR